MMTAIVTPVSPAQQSTTAFSCGHCSREFKYESERKRHEASHYPQFECDVCEKKFSFISALRRHRKQHDRSGSVKCEDCGRKFRDDTLLKRHIRYAHKGTYSCSKCNASFSSELALGAHMKTHKPENERQFRCSYEGCGKTFNFSHHLKHHELTHTNMKQHFCSVCGKGFIQSHHLKTHLKTHDPGEWLYCEMINCKKKFATEYARKRHMAQHNKNNHDSGVSSDSNSAADAFSRTKDDNVDDTVQCVTCGLSVLVTDYEIHSFQCLKKEESNKIIEDLNNDMKESLNVTEPEILNDISDCKSALGNCIINDPENNCLCAQITSEVDDSYELLPIERNLSTDGIKFDINENNDACHGCECANICRENNITPANCPNGLKGVNANMPTIEYRDGTVRIKDTFDIDISPAIDKHDNNNDAKYVPFNSCKDVLGNCIVSGNGTMGEGCLCAKMMMDDQVAMAQEMEDIIPQPKTDAYSMM